jgi:transcriptional regulator with XRE-family HTH domain
MYAQLAYTEYIMWRKDDVVKQLQDEQKAKKLSLRSYAKSLRVSPSYLSDVYRGRRDPGPALLDHLELDRKVVTTVTYVKRRWR